MKHTLFLTMLAATLLGSGVANAAETLYLSDFKGTLLSLGTEKDYDKLVVNISKSVMMINLYDGAAIEFLADNSGAICSISTTPGGLSFMGSQAHYNITFDTNAEGIVAASAGAPITLIQCTGTGDFNLDSLKTLTLKGVASGGKVDMGGVQFTYVGPQDDNYTFQAGEIGFTGYYDDSRALNLVAKAPAVPEPTTGSLSLLALAGLCARRRK